MPLTLPSESGAYLRIALAALPRLLSYQDRDPLSPTYGSFDRQHWAWANKDFANADLQRGVLPLAVLYSRPFPGNDYFRSPAVREWIQAGLQYWCAIQHGNGSFDQWYPREYSVGTTAFTLGPLIESAALLGEELPSALRDRLHRAFCKAGDFLLGTAETHGFIANHQAGAALALHRLFSLTGDQRYAAKSVAILAQIRQHQSTEGWFSEYGGADPGYETLGVYYLAALWQASQDDKLLDMLRRCLGFLVYFFHPNGTVGGEYGSRGTELFYPAGFEILAPRLEQAAAVAAWMRQHLDSAMLTTPLSSDVPNFVPLLSNYTTAAMAAAALPPCPPLPVSAPEPFSRHFPEAGLYVIKTAAYYAVAGLSKGGTLRIYTLGDHTLVHCDAGYRAELTRHRQTSTQLLDHRRAVRVSPDGAAVEVEAPFYHSAQQRMTPLSFLLLRLFSATFGRRVWPGVLLKRFLAQQLIGKRQKADLVLLRSLRFHPDQVEIEDHIRGSLGLVRQLGRGSKFAAVFMGSARYFSAQELSGHLHEVSPAGSQNGRDWHCRQVVAVGEGEAGRHAG